VRELGAVGPALPCISERNPPSRQNQAVKGTRRLGPKEQLATRSALNTQVVDQVVSAGRQLWVSGQVAIADGKLLATGILGADVDAETGQRCARQCAANVLERVVDAYGGLDRVARVLKLSVYVASAPGFTEQHVVANGASELLVEVLGEAGRHARVAVGVAALPLGSPVEVEAVILVDPERAASATTDPVTGVRRS